MERYLLRNVELESSSPIPDEVSNYQIGEGYTAIVLARDAQATVEALQADTRTYINERHENMKQIEELRQQVAALQAQLESANTLLHKKNCAIGKAETTIEALQAVIDDHHRLVRELDVSMNGAEGAAKQASLCDLVSQIQALQRERDAIKRSVGLDCGDQSCLYALEHSGMRTNGGCRCSPKRMKDDLERSHKAVEALQRELRLSRFNQANAEAEYNGLQVQIRTLTQQLDAEREKVKCEQEQWEIQAREGGRLKEQLSQLQDWRDRVTLALQREGGARFEDVPGHVKTVVDDLTQLQALVRALPEMFGTITVEQISQAGTNCALFDAGGWIATVDGESVAKALKSLLQYRAGLDATTPDSNQLGAINDMVSKGGDGE